MKTVLVPADGGLGQYGIKGIGETPNTPTAAAIANAIEDAIGVRIRDLPITSEKVYNALKARCRPHPHPSPEIWRGELSASN